VLGVKYRIVAGILLMAVPSLGEAMSALELSLRMGAPWELHLPEAAEGAMSSSILLHVSPGGALVAAGRLDCGAGWHAEVVGALPDLALGPARLITTGCDAPEEAAQAAAFLEELSQVRRFEEVASGYALVDAAGLPRLMLQGDVQP
jgi:hypothetical protein